MEQQSLFSSLSVTHPTYASTPLKGRGILSYVHLSSLCNHKSGFFLTAGNPLYEAQNSDFLKRRVADLRKIWRNWRKCVKYLCTIFWRNFYACVDACTKPKICLF